MLVGAPFGLGPFELLLILAVIIIIFGVGRLPEVGGAIGRGIREFRKATKEPEDEPPQINEAQSVAGGEASAAAEPRPSAPTAITCQKCGSTNAADAKFCKECGASLEAPVG
jgi:sec-independent protein translocase protein TatA